MLLFDIGQGIDIKTLYSTYSQLYLRFCRDIRSAAEVFPDTCDIDIFQMYLGIAADICTTDPVTAATVVFSVVNISEY